MDEERAKFPESSLHTSHAHATLRVSRLVVSSSNSSGSIAASLMNDNIFEMNIVYPYT